MATTKSKLASSTSSPPAEDSEGPDLLSLLEKRQSEAYHNIHFNVTSVNGEFQTRSKRNFNKRISFDTINISYDDDDDEDEYDEEFLGRYEFLDRNRGRNRYRSPSPSHSPLHSPSRRMLSPLGDQPMDSSVFRLPPRTDYPTRPIITHRGCTYTKIHRQWEELYQGNLEIVPVLPHRVILVYISGRQHTWVALDWILSKYIEHGDSVVIVASIPREFPARRRSTFRSPTPPPNARTPVTRMRQRHRPEYAKVIAKNVMSYAMQVINPQVISKVSVELALGGTKEVLKEMYKLYEPNMVSTGAKINLKSSAPLRSWNSSRLSDRLVKNFPLPVVVVPAVNMNKFETTLQSRLNEEDHGVSTASTTSVLGNEDSDSASINSEVSSSTTNSDESYSSYDEISKIYGDYRQSITKKLQALKKKDMGDSYFANFLTMMSDKSVDLCNDIRDINPHFSGRGAKLARAITGSNAFGTVPYKTKSLLEPSEKAKSLQNLSYKEMMKNLKTNSQPPEINVEQHEEDHTKAPKASALKFVDPEPPRKEKSFTLLKKSLSHDMSDLNVRPKLEPLKSHPDLHAVSSGTGSPKENSDKPKKKKKKRSKLWSLFK